jgi:hypothetical protein
LLSADTLQSGATNDGAYNAQADRNTLTTAPIAAAAAQPAFAAKHSRTAPVPKPALASQHHAVANAASAQRGYSRYQNGAMSAPAGR